MSDSQDPLLEKLRLLRRETKRLQWASMMVCAVAIAVLILAILKYILK